MNPADSLPPPQDALDWLLLRELGAPDPAREAAFQAWLAADPLHGGLYAEALRTHRMGQLARIAAAPEPQSVRQRPVTSRRAWAGSAAALAAGLALAMVFGPALLWDSYATAVGERRMVTLADGSTVHLNGATEVRVRFTGDARRIELRGGEALFEVAHDPSRPFRVQAGDRIVQAVGTGFDIDLRADAVSVAVTDGVVALLPDDGNGQPVRLEKGHAISYAPAQAPGKIRQVAIEQIGTWRRDVLFFDDAPLETIAVALRRRYPGQFVIADPRLGGRRFSGTITLRERNSTLRDLSRALSVRLQEKPGDRFEFVAAAGAP